MTRRVVWGEKEVEWRGRKAEMEEEQLRRQAEHLTQRRSLPVSATRRRRWGGEPRRRSAKYWPEPVAAPEVRGDLTERRRRSAARSWEGEGKGVGGSKGNLRYSEE